MATITLKNVPDALYERLKRSAARRRRSINGEAIVCLERALAEEPLDVSAFLAQARRARAMSPDVFVTEADLRDAIDAGRP